LGNWAGVEGAGKSTNSDSDSNSYHDSDRPSRSRSTYEKQFHRPSNSDVEISMKDVLSEERDMVEDVLEGHNSRAGATDDDRSGATDDENELPPQPTANDKDCEEIATSLKNQMERANIPLETASRMLSKALQKEGCVVE
jgi:hypothetical protein